MRHLASGGGALRELNDLRGPMSLVLEFFVQQQQELARYKQMYGELPPLEGDQNTTTSKAKTLEDADSAK